jgi:hypothetical protein
LFRFLLALSKAWEDVSFRFIWELGWLVIGGLDGGLGLEVRVLHIRWVVLVGGLGVVLVSKALALRDIAELLLFLVAHLLAA